MCRDPSDTTSKVSSCVEALSVSKIAILYLMLAYECPRTPLKISLHENKTTVKLKSASFIVIMLLHKGLTHIQSQIKPGCFLVSFNLSSAQEEL